MAVRQCVGNAMLLAGVNHAAFTAAHHTTRASAGWDALDFFALKTRAGFVARADACDSSSTRSAWRNHVPRIWNRSMRLRSKRCQEKNTKCRRKSYLKPICSGVVSGHTLSKQIRVWHLNSQKQWSCESRALHSTLRMQPSAAILALKNFFRKWS